MGGREGGERQTGEGGGEGRGRKRGIRETGMGKGREMGNGEWERG